jgi:hypothetical protein
MKTQATTTEYAQTLIERYNSMRKAVGGQKLHQIFLGAKASVEQGDLDPAVKIEMLAAYKKAEQDLFPD